LDELFVVPGGAFILGESSGAIPLGEAPTELQNALGDGVASALEAAMGENTTPDGTSSENGSSTRHYEINAGQLLVAGGPEDPEIFDLGSAPANLRNAIRDATEKRLNREASR
jgi:hypothetical protein